MPPEDLSQSVYGDKYRDFEDSIFKEIRREAFGEDIGQNSWLTTDECIHFIKLLKLRRTHRLLDVACGSGGPTLFLAERVGCRVTGVDIDRNAIGTAKQLATKHKLRSPATFRIVNAGEKLPFEPEWFDDIICIDAMNHLPNRPGVLRDWYRVLKPKGRILFTDPVVVTGAVSNEELAVRSSIGYFLFTPPGQNELLLDEAGFKLMLNEDATDQMALISERRCNARARHKQALIKMEGKETYSALQRFYSLVHKVASERRLSRFAFLAEKV
jgi:SAM-dependent methyltransferase